MDILIYFYEFFRIIIFLFNIFKGPNLFLPQDNDMEYIKLDDIEYIVSSTNELQPIVIENVLEENQEEPVVRRRNTNRRCGYCREIGHYVNDCNNQEVITQSRALDTLITDPTTTIDIIRQWINSNSEHLVKVILCKKRLINITSNANRRRLENVILNHMHEINNGRVALQNIINNVNELVDSYRNEIQLPNLEITDENLYNKLSITTSIVTNNSNDILCPICFDSIEQKNICKTDCNHEFCKDCVDKTLRDNILLKTHSECPLCRNTISHLFLSS
jgi:hypothetical protein